MFRGAFVAYPRVEALTAILAQRQLLLHREEISVLAVAIEILRHEVNRQDDIKIGILVV